jgi:hypothetical protein
MSFLSILLFANIFLLNYSNKLMICAALFTGSALVVDSMVEFYGKRKAIFSLVTCTLLVCILKWQSFSLMLLISYTGILVSLILSIIIFEKLKSRCNFHVANLITLIAASIVDSAIVCTGLLYKFSVGKCFSIYMRDLIFKFSYASILSACLFVGVYLFYLAKKKYAKLSA